MLTILIEEHHIAEFDASSFFTLHDYDNSQTWDVSEIQKTYGLSMPHDSPYATNVSPEKAASIADEVLKLMDIDNDGLVQRQEWLIWYAKGGGMPDFGLGPGHHGDDEYEYEIHHWEKYHDENTKEEDLTHPEDIAHFRHHDELEDEEERQAQMDKLRIVEENIPQMFRRN